jgi:hypothetical protein
VAPSSISAVVVRAGSDMVFFKKAVAVT